MTKTPSPRQAEMLRRAAAPTKWGVPGFGPLAYGGHKGTYDALLRRGWIAEIEIDRDSVGRNFGLGKGLLASITDAGREALTTYEEAR